MIMEVFIVAVMYGERRTRMYLSNRRRSDPKCECESWTTDGWMSGKTQFIRTCTPRIPATVTDDAQCATIGRWIHDDIARRGNG
jgi:hypothetical protein